MTPFVPEGGLVRTVVHEVNNSDQINMQTLPFLQFPHQGKLFEISLFTLFCIV